MKIVLNETYYLRIRLKTRFLSYPKFSSWTFPKWNCVLTDPTKQICKGNNINLMLILLFDKTNTKRKSYINYTREICKKIVKKSFLILENKKNWNQILTYPTKQICKENNGKYSTARIAIAQKPDFQQNPNIRCVVFENFQKKNFCKEKFINI